MTPDLVTRFRAARTDPALAVLEGFHAIKHAIRFGARFDLIATRDPAALAELAGQLAGDVTASLRTAESVDAETFSALSPTPPDTGVIAVAHRPGDTLATVLCQTAKAPIIWLESPAHSGNIGAVIRASAGAGADAVVATGTNDPWNPGAIRGSAGLHFALPVVRASELAFGSRVLIAIDPEGESLTAGSIPANSVLAFGTERAGLSDELLARAHRRIAIPMEPGVSSLNLATSVAVTLYTWRLGR